MILVSVAAWEGRDAGAPVLCFAILPGTLATLFEGPVFGAVISALMLAAMTAIGIAHPPSDQAAFYHLTNEMVVVVFGFLLSWALDARLHLLQNALLRQRDELEKGVRTGQEMAQALFDQLGPKFRELNECLRDPRLKPEVAISKVDGLIKKLGEARALYGSAPKDAPEPNRDGDFRSGLATASVQLLFGIELLFFLRNAIWGGPLAVSIAMLIVLAALMLALKRRPTLAHSNLVANTLVIGSVLSTAAAFLAWHLSPDSPNLVLFPGLIFMASMLIDGVVAVGAFLACQFMVGGAAWIAPLRNGQNHLLVNIAVLNFLMGAVAYSVIQLRRAFLAQYTAQILRSGEALRLRRRLAGTLFHDVNNQLAAIQLHLELGAGEGGFDEETLKTARQLAGRMENLVNASRNFLLGEQAMDRSQMKSLPVTSAFRDVSSLFEFRLSKKQLTLVCSRANELNVWGLPEIVTESVLGNLVNNAIKFAPRGSVIALRARRIGDQVALAVCDHGPGIPKDVLGSLTADGPLPSSRGSAGEVGQGYGLKLVQEHLVRQGGRLELVLLDRGGTLAVAWLKAA